jgi:hypothetical protein
MFAVSKKLIPGLKCVLDQRTLLLLRNAWARPVGVVPSDVATGASVSQLVGLVAASVPDGTKVLTVDNEFTSVTFPFAAQRHRGVTVKEAKPAELLSQLRGHDLVAPNPVLISSLPESAANLAGRALTISSTELLRTSTLTFSMITG